MKVNFGFLAIVLIISIIFFSSIVKAQTHYQGVPKSIWSLFTPNTCKSMELDKIQNFPGVECGKKDPIDSGWDVKLNYNSYTYSKAFGFTIAVNFYDNVKAIDKNYTLNQNDKVCVGDTIKLENREISGEWFGKGGPIDSPPITWVSKDEYVKILRNYINYYKQHPIKPNFDIGVDENYRIIDNNNIESYNSQKKYGTYTGEIIGNSLYVFDMPWIGHFAGWNSPTALIRSSDDTILDKKIMLYEHRFNMPFYWGYGTLICTSNSGLISSSGKFSYSSFKISESGKIEIEMNSQPSCMFYMEMDSDVYDEVYKIFSLNENPIDMFNVEDAVKAMTIANLTTKFTLEAVPTTQELDLKIKDYSINGNQIMFLVKNTGNVEATVNDIQSDIPLTVLEKTKVKPGETTEVYAKLEDIPRSDRINFNLVYRTDELGCLKTKEYGVKTGFIGCKSDFQCSSILNSGICCEGSCKDSREGVCRDENGDGLMEWILFG